MNPTPLARLLATDTPSGHSKAEILAINNGGVYIADGHWLAGSDLIRTKPLNEARTQSIIVPHMTILHTQAASTKATNDNAWNYAQRADIDTEAHVYGPDMVTGQALQAMPFNRRADSNYRANEFLVGGVNHGAISMETQDAGSRTLNDTPWTWPQLGTMLCILTAVHFTYRISCTACGWARGGGCSQHNAWANDREYPWSKTAHSCPGTARTKQMDGIRQELANRLAKIYTDCGESCPGS